ncbi:MAG: hypothetical protein JWM39_608 [Parcubacteria group bacterium]|nr:hypothetical protein [Parcubacteria group bacterium]
MSQQFYFWIKSAGSDFKQVTIEKYLEEKTIQGFSGDKLFPTETEHFSGFMGPVEIEGCVTTEPTLSQKIQNGWH